jgi:NAD(P)-dependent dehydrogenase (short-subunit alcohol dehydrogenase family)
MFSLNSKTALVTGASRGLGLALSLELARRGWHLIVNGRDPQKLKEAARLLSSDTVVTAVAGDVVDPQHRQELSHAAQAAGGLDAIINNAGTLGASPLPALLDYPQDALEQVFRVNVFAPLAILQAIRPSLKPGACIINVTSDAAREAYAGWGGYGASKAALEQLSAILAVENPELRIYWVDPGDMRTQMQQAAFPGQDIGDRPLPEQSVPGLLALLEGKWESGRYLARELIGAVV